MRDNMHLKCNFKPFGRGFKWSFFAVSKFRNISEGSSNSRNNDEVPWILVLVDHMTKTSFNHIKRF